jgi:hypothetical protein
MSPEGRVTLPQVKQRTGIIIFTAAADSRWSTELGRGKGLVVASLVVEVVIVNEREASEAAIIVSTCDGLWAGRLGLAHQFPSLFFYLKGLISWLIRPFGGSFKMTHKHKRNKILVETVSR